jgi:hypothetical protein
MTKEGDDSDVEAIANFIVGSHLTLAYLWIIGRDLSEPVNLKTPQNRTALMRRAKTPLEDSRVREKNGHQNGPRVPTQGNQRRRKAVAGAIAKAPAEVAPIPPQILEAQGQRATTTLTAQTTPNPPQEDQQPSPSQSHSPPPHRGQERDRKHSSSKT